MRNSNSDFNPSQLPPLPGFLRLPMYLDFVRGKPRFRWGIPPKPDQKPPARLARRQRQTLTFEQLCALEPRLAELYNRAKSIKHDPREPYFCANEHWYGWKSRDRGLREQLAELVGWAVRERRGDPRLATSQAYDVAYRGIYSALPDCRNCVCVGFGEFIETVKAERLKKRAPRRN